VTFLNRKYCASLPAFAFRYIPQILLLSMLIAGFVAGFATSAVAQAASANKSDKPYALIFGTVWGPDDRPVYGIKIKIRRENDHKARWEQVSNHSGEFAQRMPAGKQDYVISADLKGVKTADGKRLQAEDVNVHIENDERADVGLHLKKVE
jgi:hypothetical protein